MEGLSVRLELALFSNSGRGDGMNNGPAIKLR